MTTMRLSTLARAIALCGGALIFAAQAQTSGNKDAYEQVKATAKSTYEADKKACDAMSGNAEDICEKQAKARRIKAEVQAEAAWRNTPKAREKAIKDSAEADYEVAKERCDDLAGNPKDVCRREAKAAMVRVVADAKATKQGSEARMEAADDKRDADYKVAAGKCDAMAGDAKRSCVDAAKSRYRK